MTDSFNIAELHALCQDGDEAAFDRLRERWGSAVDVNAVDRHGQTPAMIALLHHENPVSCWEWLNQDDDMDWSIARSDGQRLVHLVAAHGTADQMRHLTDQSMALDAPDNEGCTALHRAAQHGNAQTVEVLRTFGANPLAQNDQGQTPIDLARAHGRAWVMRALERPFSPDTILAHVVARPAPYPEEVLDQVDRALHDGADPNVTLDGRVVVLWSLEPGSSALHAAVARQDLAVVQRLLRAGAQVNAVNANQAVPLLLGIPGDVAIVQALLDAGADPMRAALDRPAAWEIASTLVQTIPSLQTMTTVLMEARVRWEKAALRATLNGDTPATDDPAMPRRRL